MRHTRHILLVMLATVLPAMLLAQSTPLTGPRRAEVLAAIARTQQPPAGKTLCYSFVQTKHSPLLANDAVSKGKLNLGDGRSMQWQYTEPQAFSLVVEGDSIYTVSGGKRQSLTGAGGKMTRGLAQMMMQLTDGASLADDKLFETSLTEEGDSYRAVMVPKRRDMRRMMQQAELLFDRKTLRIRSVTLTERNDSYTKIDFKLQ